jgi:prepilin-type N-terminal cleavage/methylation domain-containing protein
MSKQYREQGFSLIELLMVITLISILVRIGISQFIDFSSDARTAVTNTKLNAIKVAIIGDARFVAGGKNSKQGFEVHCLAVPTALTDLTTQPASGTCASTYDPFTKRGWRGPYVTSTDSTWSTDAWGTAFVYSSGSRTIKSCGRDKSCVTTTDDITLSF